MKDPGIRQLLKETERRYAGYLDSFIVNIDAAEKSLLSYESGQHKTDF